MGVRNFGRPVLFTLLFAVACGGPEPTEPEPSEEPERIPSDQVAEPTWPQEGAPLEVTAVTVPEGFETRQIYIDAGHGAPSNVGAVGAYCQQEQDFTLRAADELAERLRRTGAFEVRVSRAGEERPGYTQRVRAANEWADVLISLHFDARLAAEAETWAPTEGESCRYNVGEHGFSVLYSDEGAPELAERREALAEQLASSLAESGLPPYLGEDYVDLYELDPEQPGAWVDRHDPGKRIMMLRAPRVPSVIIETHQALDRDEVLRWQEERTYDAFAAAVASGLIDYFQQTPSGS